jgi:voltage-gated potassium channel
MRTRWSRLSDHGTSAFEMRQRRRNVRALFQFFAFAVSIVLLDSVLFHVVMWHYEGQRYSPVTGLYWTLSTMSTLGLGDIVFESDVGKVYTVLVLVSGIVLLFVVFPFAFIRFFYAPWIATRRVSDRIANHVIITSFDTIAPALVDELELHGIPYYVIEPDGPRAQGLEDAGIAVVSGSADDRATYDRLRVGTANLVVATAEDTTNTNVTLTVREAAASVPIMALVDNEASIDILELAGATRVLALKSQLGEQLANRLNAGHAQVHVIGMFRDALIAEFPVLNTPFAGRTIRELQLREAVGVNIVGILEQTRFLSPTPDTLLTKQSVLVVVGTQSEMDQLDEFLVIYDPNYKPVLVIGGGMVGRAASRLLKRKGVPVHLIEKDPALRDVIGDLPDKLFMGDAAELEVMRAAGLAEAPGVVITTNDDATNIYLTVYCRRLAPGIRIMSRITHERNRAAIRRAGADLALSHISLGVQSAFALLRGHELVVLGEGIELHELPIPDSLVGKDLATAGIASRTGLNVIAIQDTTHMTTNPVAGTVLQAGSRLVMIGDREQLEIFQKVYV